MKNVNTSESIFTEDTIIEGYKSMSILGPPCVFQNNIYGFINLRILFCTKNPFMAERLISSVILFKKLKMVFSTDGISVAKTMDTE